MCQLASGAPVVAWIVIDAGGVSWTSAAPARYQSSPRGIRSFCGTCGTQLAFEVPGQPKSLDLNTATLDDPSPFAPTCNDYVGSRILWCDAGRDLPDNAAE
jgi:hypothetical protein